MHYYTLEGESKHEIVGANGKLRPTTIADARKLKLVPSVTTVMDVQSKPALINWIQDQLIQAAIAEPFHPDEWEIDRYKKYLINASKQVGKDAAAKGNYIHNVLDQYFMDSTVSDIIAQQAIDLIHKTFPLYEWHSEMSFAHESGFGGRVDLWGKCDNDYVIVDFKTKDKEDIKAVKAYDDYKMQLAAYQVGLKLPSDTRRYNLFISTAKGCEGECNLVESDDFKKPWEMFAALLQFWKVKNNYDSSF